MGTSFQCKIKASSFLNNVNNQLAFDKAKVAEHFNAFFSKMASKIVKQLPTSLIIYCFTHFSNYYGNRLSNNASFNLCQVVKDKVFQTISSLNSNKVTGLDLISSKLLNMVLSSLKLP